MSMESALQTFFAEAEELLQNMEAALLRLEDGDADSETLNEIFRAAHTIKGSAGLFGLNAIVGFTHVVENLLDRARNGTVVIDSGLQGLLLRCRDHINTLVSDVANERESTPELMQTGDLLLRELMEYLDKPATADESQDAQPEETASADSDSSAAVPTADEPAPAEAWHISLRMGPDVLRNGMDPLSFIRFLGTLGEVTQLVTLDDHLPELEEFDAESLYLGFEIDLVTDAGRAEIEDVFSFVRDDSDIRILPPHSKVMQYIELIQSLPEGHQRLGEILVRSGAITQVCLDRALARQAQLQEQQQHQMLGEILTAQQATTDPVIHAALERQKKAPERRAGNEARSIRVDAEKLDHLINLIGELVISRQRVDLLAAQTGHGPLLEAVAALGSFTENIRDAALTLRMVQIGDSFQRFRRIVRDTAHELGKSIELEISGAETELDRSMVEKLTDPLTHIVRNALDHGIESVETRRERGKPDTGTLRLSAYHDAGNIVIEISDDGGGLNVEKIRAKAIANGLIDPQAELSDHDLHQLIFHPGFSTAEKVTDLSGRGVGMDVVRRNIEALQGGVDIESEFGTGTLLRIRLPLTLAIIDGFHVSARNTQFIIPQTTVLECMDLASLPAVKGRNCVNLRGEPIPYIRLSDIFALNHVASAPEEVREKLVVVQFGNERAGIVVEQLYGEVQTVVKPLSPIFQSLKGVGGSSLLGSGDIAFILDIPQLIELTIQREARQASIASPSKQEHIA